MTVWALEGLPEIHPGDDLATLIGDAAGELQEGDILAVTSKIVSKAEGRIVQAADREDAITAETVRVVATRGQTRIVQNEWGQVMAAAGVDSSNTDDGTVLLLPANPDASARALCVALRERFGIRLGVLITDTFGRPWRDGQTDVAIGGCLRPRVARHPTGRRRRDRRRRRPREGEGERHPGRCRAGARALRHRRDRPGGRAAADPGCGERHVPRRIDRGVGRGLPRRA
jgi:coenzyme F420-0:L-glutamate ligase